MFRKGFGAGFADMGNIKRLQESEIPGTLGCLACCGTCCVCCVLIPYIIVGTLTFIFGLIF